MKLAACAALLVLLAACGPVDGGSPKSSSGAHTATMPNLVGTNLQQAQDKIQQLVGDPVYLTTSHDASGKGRQQVSDSNWKVCTQNVKPGEQIGMKSTIDFGVVKNEESCPADGDAAARTTTAAAAQWTMPNLVGKNLQAAQDTMQSLTGDPAFLTTSHDATGAGRHQVLDSNWKVCTQNVKPGERIGMKSTIDFGAVKNEESCP